MIAVAIAAGVVTWLLIRGNGNSNSVKQTPTHAASVRELTALPATIHHRVYWAGAKPGFTYELTQTRDGRIFIRYLPRGVRVGTSQPKYLTVGTYPVKDPIAAVRGIGRRTKSTPVAVAGGGLAVQDGAHPTSVYVAYPRSPYEIEIFDPAPALAQQLALSGQIVPIGSATTRVAAATPRAVTPADLRAFASSLGHSVYWAGQIPKTTLELSQTADGRVYVRYLPRGVSAGDRKAYLTVGTYPVADAVAAVQNIAHRPGARQLTIAHGTAVVDPAHPTSVYLAFDGSKDQIEVFDPNAARARQLVSLGRIKPVR